MKIKREDKYEKRYPKIDSIKPGTAFEYNGRVYIKTTRYISTSVYSGLEAVCLSTGDIITLDKNEGVRPLDTEVVVKQE